MDRFGAAASAAAAAAAPLLDDTPHEMAFRNDIGGRTIQPQYVTAYDDAALAVASGVSWPQLAAYANCATNASATCQNGFVTTLGRLMYRRPLTPAEVSGLVALYNGPNAPANQDPTPFQTGSRLVVQAMLLSPNFLYQLETELALPPATPAAPTPYEMATRLAMLVWKAGPDAALLDAAAAGKMATAAGIDAQLGRMMADPRARRGVRAFTDDWLGIYVVPNRDLVGGLTPSVLADMRSETLRFVERLAIDDKADLTQLFLDKKTELSPELSKLYGLTPIGTAPTAVYDLASNPNRIGVLTQPAVLGVRAGPAAASIAQRGHWLLNTVLCRDIDPPTQAALDLGAKVQAALPPTATERDFFMQHETFGAACQGCHAQMDPLGFPFVTFDVAGAFVTKDANGNVLRTDGTLSLDNAAHTYKDVVELSTILAKSPTIDDCFVRKYVQYALGRTVTARVSPSSYADDLAQIEALVPAFRQQGRQFGQLVAMVAKSPIFQAPARDMFP